MSVSDGDFVRYQRQISLPAFGEVGQERLSTASVLVVGCGGLGSSAITLLAGAGVGKLVIADNDCVDISNLHRQTHYNSSNVGCSKVLATKSYIEALNDSSKVRAINTALTGEQLELECLLADMVLDCSDNLKTRHEVNRACFESKTPLVSAAAIGWNGQLAVYDYQPSSACYHCLFPFVNDDTPKRCSDSGVMGPVVSMMGSYQALEAIKFIAQVEGRSTANTLYAFNGLLNQWQRLSINKDKQCRVCN